MGQVENSPERATHSVDQTDTTVREGHSALASSKSHRLPGCPITRLVVGCFEMASGELNTGQRERVCHAVGLAGYKRLHAMNQGVYSNMGGQLGRHGEAQFVIDNRDLWHDLAVEDQHLYLPRGVGDNGGFGGLTTRAGRSGDSDKR